MLCWGMATHVHRAGAPPAPPFPPVLALAHVVVAAAGVVTVLAFAIAAVACLRLRRTASRRAARLSLVLGVVELVLAVALLWGVVVAVQGYGEPAPWRSPLLLPALVVAGIGTAAVVDAARTLRAG